MRREQWAPIPDTGGAYEVSTAGRVRRRSSGRVLRPNAAPAGGLETVNLYLDGRTDAHAVRELMSRAFARTARLERWRRAGLAAAETDDGLVEAEALAAEAM